MSALAYVNGAFVPAHEATLSIHDAGVVSGATVTDFCRTFRRRLFRWSDHLSRFRRDCAACFVPLSASDDEITAAAQHLIGHNGVLLPDGGELALVTFATPGPLGAYAGAAEDGPPTLVMHTMPLSFARYRRFFTEGVALAVVGSHGGSDLAPAYVKHRSRLHWWRAGHLLRQRSDVPPGALALMTGPGEHVTETAIGNLLVVRDGVVITPPAGEALDGISLRVVRELCAELDVQFAESNVNLADLRLASEAMLCGTAFCLAGVSWAQGDSIAWPGPVTMRLQRAWSGEVGLDFVAQMLGESPEV